MAGVYGGFTSVPNLLMEPRGFHPISYLRIPKNFNFCDAGNHTFFPWLYMKVVL
jgi:hypothetical protein